MKRHISSVEFEKMTNSARKRYVGLLLIQEANSMPVEPPSLPIAIDMAGLPGAGFLASCTNISTNLKKALEQFDDNPNFSAMLVKQKKLRDKNYEVIIERTDMTR